MVSKEDFLSYEYALKHSTPETFNRAILMKMAGLSREMWFEITKNYSSLKDKYIRGVQ